MSRIRRFISNSDFQKECNSCILGIHGSVRGYTNLLFDRGVYEKQTENSLNKVAIRLNKCACYIDIERIGGGGMIKINSHKFIKGKSK